MKLVLPAFLVWAFIVATLIPSYISAKELEFKNGKCIFNGMNMAKTTVQYTDPTRCTAYFCEPGKHEMIIKGCPPPDDYDYEAYYDPTRWPDCCEAYK
uniref:Putative kDa family member n=1 Tax=Rhipicephalus microplus TaxID=6941 RepID=A0A6G5A4P8_RHIMP